MTLAPLVRGLAVTLVLASVAAAPLAFTAASAAPSKGNPAIGKPLFAKNCMVCHKVDGSGDRKSVV